jgi:hypothetical protein
MGDAWSAGQAVKLGLPGTRATKQRRAFTSATAVRSPPHSARSSAVPPTGKSRGGKRRDGIKLERIARFRQAPMPDYYHLLARAISALSTNTATTKARRRIYDMARHALVKQARAIEPEMGEVELTRERLELERAIRKVEAEELESNPAKRALICLARHIENVLADFAVR